MRLINTETGYFEEFVDSTTAPLYAILSHTWNKPPELEPEQSYQDVVKIQQRFQALQPSRSEKEPHTLSNTTPSIHQTVEETGFLPGPSIPEDTEPSSEVERAYSSATRPSIWDPDSGLSEKIREACRVAREDGYRYIWVDSSCIDKTSSSELSEAINSMFNWYRDAQICYAFLSDVPSDEDVTAAAKVEDTPMEPLRSYFLLHNFMTDKERATQAGDSKFRKSRWFQRSWTLQELIAPHVVVFLARDWKGLGTKHSLAKVIEEITHIDRDILTHNKAVADESVAERMRWAASREATRVEDEAYSLLGIFGITMTTVYGEGRNAFQRLQEEILQRIPDRSLFAWHNTRDKDARPIHTSQRLSPYQIGNSVSRNLTSPFATSPRLFAIQGGKINALSEQDFKRLQLPIEEYSLTPHGIRAKIRLIRVKFLVPDLKIRSLEGDPHQDSVERPWYVIVLGSQHPSHDDQTKNYLLGKLCCITRANSSIQLLEVHGGKALIWTDFKSVTQSLLETSIDVYLPRPKLSIVKRKPAGDKSNRPQLTRVSFSPWAARAMPPGYTISELRHCPNQDRCLRPYDSSSLSLLLSNTELVTLCIQYRHMPYIVHWDSFPGRPITGAHFGAFVEARVWIVESPNSIALDDGALYASAIWSTSEKSSSLPIQDIPVPVTQSGESTWVTLQLWLGISRYGHYHAHVEVATTGNTVNPNYAYKRSTRCFGDFPFNDDAPLRIPEPHSDFKFTMLGATKRALEAQGYSVNLEASNRNLGNSYSSPSSSLEISDSNVNPTFTISIQYFHNRRTRPSEKFPHFVFVARVTLESVPGQGFEGFQDGPYVLNWADHYVWAKTDTLSPIYLSTPRGDVLALKLDLDRAWVSEYYLVVDLARNGDSNSQTGVSGHYSRELQFRLVDPHDNINLTFPTYIRHTLQTHGYKVQFEQNDDVYHLTLSNANHAINIDYFHHLSTGLDGQQGLTFRACVTGSVLQSSQDAAAQTECQTINWDAWKPERRNGKGEVEIEGGWRWKLHKKDVKLALPDGLELTLRLSLYLVWLSEYCITVDVIPPAANWMDMIGSLTPEASATRLLQLWSMISSEDEASTSQEGSPICEAQENASGATRPRPTVGLEANADSPAAASVMLPTTQTKRRNSPSHSPSPDPSKKSRMLKRIGPYAGEIPTMQVMDAAATRDR